MPPWAYWLSVLALGGAAVYYGAMISGLYKDPIMARFRRYGTERLLYPFPRFLRVLGGLGLLLAPLIPAPWTAVVFGLLAVLLIIASFFVEDMPYLRAILPRWYASLLAETTREERRAIAYAWLRLPFKTRMRLNGDQYAFRIFVDEVRLTIIYGARDPDDPWAMWQ